MADLLQQLAAAKTDDERQDAVAAHVVDALEDPVREAAMILAVPHWFDDAILRQLEEPDARAATDHLAALTALGIAVAQADATFSLPSHVRETLLRRLISHDPDRFRRLSARYSAIFLGMTSKTLATELEEIYHALGSDPKSGARLLVDRGLLFKSEPLFQWHALERLVANAEEHYRRGILDERCRACIDLVRLFVPGLRPSPQEEVATLRRLQGIDVEDAAFGAETQVRLGYAQIAVGEVEGARATLAHGLDLCEKAARPQGRIEALRGLARLALRRDDYAEAARHFDAARKLAEERGLTASAAHSVKGMAEIDFLQGRYRGAETGFEQAIEQFRQTGARLGEANTRVSFAQLLALQHRFDQSHAHIDKAAGAYTPIRQSLGLGNCLKARGIACYEHGEPVQALDYYAQADAYYAKAGNQTGLAYSSLMKAAALIALDRLDEAEAPLRQAGDGLERLGDRYGLAMVTREQGLLAERRRSFDLALQLLSAAVTAFDALPNPLEMAATFVAAARVAARLGFAAGFDRQDLIDRAQSAARLFGENRLPRRQREAQDLIAALRASAVDRVRDTGQAEF